MIFERKTKDQSILKVIWFPLVMMPTFLIVLATTGPKPALYMVGGMMFLASLAPFLTLWKTRNPGFLALTMLLVFLGLACVSTPYAIDNNGEVGLVPIFFAGFYVMMLVVAYLGFNRKLKWRGQEVFELAAMPVEDTGDSFTARPRPAGQVLISKTEMVRFVDFMTINLIAFAFPEENRVVFVLTLPGNDLPYLLGIKKDYITDTWVAIDYAGKISVNITQEDYLLFKQDLDFDQLCQSLGDVFAEFMEFSKNGQETRIIDMMNALRLNPFM